MILLVLCVCVCAVLTVLLRVVGCVSVCVHTLNYSVWACCWELLLSFTAHWPCKHGSVSASPLSGYQHQHLPTVLHAAESEGLQETDSLLSWAYAHALMTRSNFRDQRRICARRKKEKSRWCWNKTETAAVMTI